MFKRSISTAIFLSALLVGIGAQMLADIAISGFANLTKTDSEQNHSDIEQTQPRSQSVKVIFLGWRKFGDEKFADFEAINDTDQTLKYFSYEEKKPYLVQIKIDGKHIKQFYCGTGLIGFELKSDESIRLSASISQLAYFYEKNKPLQIGYHLSNLDNSNGKEYWSDNIPIPSEIEAEFESKIRQNNKEIKQYRRNLQYFNKP